MQSRWRSTVNWWYQRDTYLSGVDSWVWIEASQGLSAFQLAAADAGVIEHVHVDRTRVRDAFVRDHVAGEER